MNKEIQNRIDNFYKENGKHKIKEVNNHCAKRKKTCPYTVSGKCRGWCLV